MLGSVIGRHNAVMSRAELRAGDFFFLLQEIYMPPFLPSIVVCVCFLIQICCITFLAVC